MAISPQNNDAFFREVDEGLRRERLETLVRRYGRMLILAVLLGLAAFAGYLWWQHEQAAKAGLDGETLTGALTDLSVGKRAVAVTHLDQLAASPRGGYRAVARMTLADVALEKGDAKAAVAAFQAVIDDQAVAAPFRDLALVRQTAVQFDTLSPVQVVERLKPLAVAGAPWFGSAGEMVAMAYLKQGKRELAGPLFAAIARDVKAPATIRSRVTQMAGILGVDAVPQDAAGAAGTAGKE